MVFVIQPEVGVAYRHFLRRALSTSYENMRQVSNKQNVCFQGLRIFKIIFILLRIDITIWQSLKKILNSQKIAKMAR